MEKNKEEQALVKLRNRADNTEQASEPSDDPWLWDAKAKYM